MLLADYIVCRTLRGLGLAPDVVAGHSFGEYAALVAAGAWSITDAIRCAWHRAAAISGAAGLEGCMAATDASPALIEESIALLNAAVSLANFNAPGQTVISGRRMDVESVMARLKQAGHAVAKLQVPYPFHSPLMRPSADRLAERLPEIPLRASEVPVISTASCRPMTQPDEFVRSLLDQFTTPVNYPAILDRICEFRPALVVEAGPRQVLTKLNQLNHQGNEPVFMAADDRAARAPRRCWECWRRRTASVASIATVPRCPRNRNRRGKDASWRSSMPRSGDAGRCARLPDRRPARSLSLPRATMESMRVKKAWWQQPERCPLPPLRKRPPRWASHCQLPQPSRRQEEPAARSRGNSSQQCKRHSAAADADELRKIWFRSWSIGLATRKKSWNWTPTSRPTWGSTASRRPSGSANWASGSTSRRGTICRWTPFPRCVTC